MARHIACGQLLALFIFTNVGEQQAIGKSCSQAQSARQLTSEIVASNGSVNSAGARSSLPHTQFSQISMSELLLNSISSAESAKSQTGQVTMSLLPSTAPSISEGVGSYIAHGLGLSKSHAVLSAGSGSQESPTFLPPSTQSDSLESFQHSHIQVSASSSAGSSAIVADHGEVLANANHTHKSDLPSNLVSVNAATFTSAVPGITSPSSFIKSSTLLVETNGTILHGYCATAAAKDPTHKAAIDCYCSETSWISAFEVFSNASLAGTSWSIGTSIFWTTVIDSYSSSISYPSNITPYTLCDGFPRVDAIPITTGTELSTPTLWTSTSSIGTPTFSSTPSCSLTPDECRYMYYNASLIDMQNFFSSANYALMTLCGVPAPLGTAVSYSRWPHQTPLLARAN